MSELEDVLQDQARGQSPTTTPPFAAVRRRAARRRRLRGGSVLGGVAVLTGLLVGVPSLLAQAPESVTGPAQGAPATPTATISADPPVASLFGPAPVYPGLPFRHGDDPVKRDELVVQSMPAHCDWDKADALSGLALQDADRRGLEIHRQWIRDPLGVVNPELEQGFSARAVLPTDAVDTGYRTGAVELWLAADRSAAYFVNGRDRSDVERWPQAAQPYLCA